MNVHEKQEIIWCKTWFHHNGRVIDSDPVPFVGLVCCGSRLAPKVFLPVLRFFSLHKIISKFQFDQDNGPARKPVRTDMASSLNIVIYLYILSNPSYLSNKIVAVFFMSCFRIRFLRGGGRENNLKRNSVSCIYLYLWGVIQQISLQEHFPWVRKRKSVFKVLNFLTELNSIALSRRKYKFLNSE